MIITDQQPSSPSSKRSFISHDSTRASSPTPTLPAPAYDVPPPAYVPPPPSSPNPNQPLHINKPHQSDLSSRRFWRAIRWGIVIYVVVSATIVTPFLVIKLRASKTVQSPDPVQTSDVPAHKPDQPQWRPPGPHGPPDWDWEGDDRWEHRPHPHPPPPFGGPGGPPHGPHGGWGPDCEKDAGRPGCHRPPGMPWRDGEVVKCNGWRRPTASEQRPVDDPMPFNAFTTFELPVDKDIFVRTAGQTTAGSFNLVVDDKVKTIEARVEMIFNEHRSYEATKVCLMDRRISNPPAMGLGIYMPREQSRNESISFKITLHVPPMIYNHTLDTHLDVFEQHIKSDPRLYLNRLRMSGAASPMFLSGVDAGTIDVKTMYARIKADGVRVGKKVRLATFASPIDATIAVTSNSSASEPVSIDLQTLNAHIAGTVLLEHDGVIKSTLDENSTERDADFLLDAQTASSPIFLRVMHTDRSEPSVLRANLTTSLGDIELALDPQFEGTFELRTENASAEVEEDAKHTIDPTGMGRIRDIRMRHESEGVVHGRVWWKNMSFRQKDGEGIWDGDKLGGPENKGGRIYAITSRAQNTLLLPSAPDMQKDTAERAALMRALESNAVDDVEERIRKAGETSVNSS